MQIMNSNTTAERLIIIRKMRELEWTDASPVSEIISATINMLQGAVLCETPEVAPFSTLASIMNNPLMANTIDADKRAVLTGLLAQYKSMLPRTSRYTIEEFSVLEENAELQAGDPRLDVETKDLSEDDEDDNEILERNNIIAIDSDNVEFFDAIRSELDEIENIFEYNLETQANTSIVEAFEEENIEDISEVAEPVPVSLPALEKSMSFHNKYVRPAVNNVIANVAKRAKQSFSFSSYMNEYFDKHAGLLTGVLVGMFVGIAIAIILPPAMPLVAAIFFKGAVGAVANLGGLGILAAAFGAVSALAGLTADYFRNKPTIKKEVCVKTEEKPVVQKTKKPLSTFAKIANELTLATHYPVDENIHQDPGFAEEQDRGLVFANNTFNQPLTSFDREPERILVKSFKR